MAACYVVRSSDGHIAQMVKNKDVAWQAGNWYLNTHSIGIEQEGIAAAGAKWYTPEMYRSTAALVRHLAAKYDIPLDRQHIIGHNEVPPTSAAGTRNMHWDPGPYWNRFMALVGPSADTPLFADPGLHTDGTPGTSCAADWGSKISATQQAVVADRSPAGRRSGGTAARRGSTRRMEPASPRPHPAMW